jgi:hypothetical protein
MDVFQGIKILFAALFYRVVLKTIISRNSDHINTLVLKNCDLK